MESKSLALVAKAAVIAALYFVLTYFLAPISFGPIQFRVSEALMLLICLLPKSAMIGLPLGVCLANYFNPQSLGVVDILGGTLASLLACVLTNWLFKRVKGQLSLEASGKMRAEIWKQAVFYLLPLPNVICNGLIVGIYLTPLLQPNAPLSVYAINLLSFSLSEAGVVYLLGLPLLYALSSQKMVLGNEG